ncbi:nickel-dependent hydrogenase large subunit [Urbifossiella limnaea]|uniref:Uncharacterized protein n=1 Tax=Urbifossiella limnaea TaxID=2528023 RepID=A0A517XMC2_9BACT|nr:nickel-dependent hydrogenase large subunit [Urbifossiella limnaea]QDU18651.1 hypothetical protein ETAA1_05440 [Urbifossiella limnaea]
MPDLVLTEEQVRVLTGASEQVTVRGPDGNALGSLDPRDAAALARHRQRRGTTGPCHSAASVLAVIDALLAERDRIGPFDAEYMRAFVERLERDDPAKYGPIRRAA